MVFGLGSLHLLKSMKSPLLIFAILVSSFTISLGQELEPDDGSIADGLVLWLRDAGNTFDLDAGTWTDASGRGNDASAVGDVDVAGPETYLAGELVTLNGSPFLDEDISAVRFGSEVNDLMVSSDINGDAGMENLTIFVVYKMNVLGNASITRPVGVGSITGTQENPGDHFNLGSDPSVRKDNGQLGSGQYAEEFPSESLFIRSARMSPDAIDDWFNTDGNTTKVLNIEDSSYVTSVDEFYLGDLRAGATATPGFGGSTAVSEFDIVQVVVYNTALSDQEVTGVNEWLTNNIEGLGEKSDPNIAAPRQFAFGQLPTVPQQVTRLIPIRNSGETQTLTVSEVILSGPQQEHFTINSVPDTIAPGSAGEISITFDLKGLTGGFVANVDVTSDDPDNPTSMIALSAQVFDPAAPANHYRFDETEGTVVADASGNGLVGEYVAGNGTLALGQEALASGNSAGVAGGAQVLLPESALDVLADSYSISLWARADSVAEPNQTLFARGESNPDFVLLLNEDKLSWLVDDEGVLATDIQTEGVVQAGMTHHIVAAYNNTAGERQLTVFLDGNVVGSVNDPVSIVPLEGSNFFVGAFQGNLPFAGRIDDLQLYGRSLSEEEVAQLFANPGEPIRTVGDAIDSDGDGLTDQEELDLGTDPLIADTDGDLLDDGDEKDTHQTDPLKADTDDDGFTDPFELAEGSDPTDPNSVPNNIGQPDLQITEIGAFGTMQANGWDTRDATFSLKVDFDAKTDGGPEVLFESGGGTVGLSLVYEAGNKLVIRQAGNGGIDVGTLEYALTDAEIAAGELELIWTTQVDNGDGMQVLRLFIDGAEVASLTAALEADWTGSNEAALGTSSSTVAAAGENTGLADTIDFESGTINTVSGLQFFSELLFMPTAPGGITWEAPDLDTTVGDLIGGPSITFIPFAYDGGNADGTFWTGDGGTTGDEMLDAVYNSHGWNADGASITLEGLTAGESYQVQLLGAGDTRGCCNTRNQAASDGTNVSGDFPRGNSSVIGSFVATGPTQEVMIVSGQDNGVDPGLSGFILTDAEGVLVSAFNVGRTEGDDITVMTSDGPDGGGARFATLENVGIQASGAFGVSLPDGVTADIEFSTDLINWEVIATGVSGALEETDAGRMAAPNGFYRAKQ